MDVTQWKSFNLKDLQCIAATKGFEIAPLKDGSKGEIQQWERRTKRELAEFCHSEFTIDEFSRFKRNGVPQKGRRIMRGSILRSEPSRLAYPLHKLRDHPTDSVKDSCSAPTHTPPQGIGNPEARRAGVMCAESDSVQMLSSPAAKSALLITPGECKSDLNADARSFINYLPSVKKRGGALEEKLSDKENRNAVTNGRSRNSTTLLSTLVSSSSDVSKSAIKGLRPNSFQEFSRTSVDPACLETPDILSQRRHASLVQPASALSCPDAQPLCVIGNEASTTPSQWMPLLRGSAALNCGESGSTELQRLENAFYQETLMASSIASRVADSPRRQKSDQALKGVSPGQSKHNRRKSDRFCVGDSPRLKRTPTGGTSVPSRGTVGLESSIDSSYQGVRKPATHKGFTCREIPPVFCQSETASREQRDKSSTKEVGRPASNATLHTRLAHSHSLEPQFKRGERGLRNSGSFRNLNGTSTAHSQSLNDLEEETVEAVAADWQERLPRANDSCSTPISQSARPEGQTIHCSTIAIVSVIFLILIALISEIGSQDKKAGWKPPASEPANLAEIGVLPPTVTSMQPTVASSFCDPGAKVPFWNWWKQPPCRTCPSEAVYVDGACKCPKLTRLEKRLGRWLCVSYAEEVEKKAKGTMKKVLRQIAAGEKERACHATSTPVHDLGYDLYKLLEGPLADAGPVQEEVLSALLDRHLIEPKISEYGLKRDGFYVSLLTPKKRISCQIKNIITSEQWFLPTISILVPAAVVFRVFDGHRRKSLKLRERVLRCLSRDRPLTQSKIVGMLQAEEQTRKSRQTKILEASPNLVEEILSDLTRSGFVDERASRRSDGIGEKEYILLGPGSGPQEPLAPLATKPCRRLLSTRTPMPYKTQGVQETCTKSRSLSKFQSKKPSIARQETNE